MLAFNIYLLGAYISLVLYALLLDVASFREYLMDFIDTIEDGNFKFSPYALLTPLAVILSIFSWLSIISIIFLMVDYILYLTNNK